MTTDRFETHGGPAWKWDFTNEFHGGQLSISDDPISLECLECGRVLTVGKDDPKIVPGDPRLCKHMEVVRWA